jgi:hypothetical protein
MRQVQPVYKISSLKITPPKTPNSEHCFIFIWKKIDSSSGLGHVIFLLIYFCFGSHIVEDFEVP